MYSKLLSSAILLMLFVNIILIEKVGGRRRSRMRKKQKNIENLIANESSNNFNVKAEFVDRNMTRKVDCNCSFDDNMTNLLESRRGIMAEDPEPNLFTDPKSFENWTAKVSGLSKTQRSTFHGDSVHLGELPHHVFFFLPYQTNLYKAFCAGNIISSRRVLTSAHCFLTNQKRFKQDLDIVDVVAGVLFTIITKPVGDESSSPQQWRKVVKLYSQKYYRFPAYNLAIAKVSWPWFFNEYVHKIAYGTKNYDYDGICNMTAVKPTTSWKKFKVLFIQRVKIIKRHDCERKLLRCCRLYYCTAFAAKDLKSDIEMEGAGLVCGGTGDPAEHDSPMGVLVGISALLNLQLPTLHNRVGMFHKWIKDGARKVNDVSNTILLIPIIVSFGNVCVSIYE